MYNFVHLQLHYFRTAVIVTGFLFITFQKGWCQNEALHNESLTGALSKNERPDQGPSDFECTSHFEQLQSAVLEDPGNNQRLINAFFPIKSTSPHLVWVFYHFNTSVDEQLRSSLKCPPSDIPALNPNINASNIESYLSSVADYTYMVADQPLLLILEFELFIGLTVFDLVNVGSGACVHLIIDPFCDTVSNETADMLLTMLSSWVSYLKRRYCMNTVITSA